MALTMSLTLENGIVLDNAYLIINTMNFIYKTVSVVEIVLNVYKDQSAYSAGKPEVLQLRNKCSGSDFDTYFSQKYLNNENKNHVASAYEWLLTLDQYSGAAEV